MVPCAAGRRFELQIAPRGDSSEADNKLDWANWSAFVEQPEGYAYRIRGSEPAIAPQVNHPSSPRRRQAPLPAKQRSSPQVTRRSSEPRLHPVHEAPTAQQQPQQEPQEQQQQQPQEVKPQQKRRIKLRRKKQPPAQPKRAQRTLLELWGR
ncbi:hypothetical protein ON010_g18641 [Phytophthora cinnamomi]|nr:hypothetical protein ON010_g18641 [Phytophthora cinnamomi]